MPREIIKLRNLLKEFLMSFWDYSINDVVILARGDGGGNLRDFFFGSRF